MTDIFDVSDTPTADEPSTTVRRIVVGVDGSTESTRALRWAGFLARRTGASIDAVIVCELPLSYGWAEGWSQTTTPWSPHADARQALNAAVDEAFGPQSPLGLRTIVLDGNGARRLIEHAAGAMMLVLGCRGNGGFAGFLLGSISTKCAAHASCPVLIVHEHDDPLSTAAGEPRSRQAPTARHRLDPCPLSMAGDVVP